MAKHLYLHVPFCRSICYYCDFCHIVKNEAVEQSWLTALQKEFSLRTFDCDLETIYIGGGTPSALSLSRLEQVFLLLSPYTEYLQEYTIELNPETVTDELVQLLVKYGVDRVSMGLQTSDDALLQSIGRHHTYRDVQQACKCLRHWGIDNISLDLMYGLPGQTMAMLQQSVLDALALAPKHLSLYSLTIEENSVFGKRGVKSVDPDLDADMYTWICEELPKHGFEHYETSNFALPHYRSLHNTAYWEYKDFYGVSCGASGKEGHMRYDNCRNIYSYCADPMQREEIFLDRDDEQFEMVMMSLRMNRGLDLKSYEQKFGESYQVRFGSASERLVEQGLLAYTEDGYVRATARGAFILNSVLVELM